MSQRENLPESDQKLGTPDPETPDTTKSQHDRKARTRVLRALVAVPSRDGRTRGYFVDPIRGNSPPERQLVGGGPVMSKSADKPKKQQKQKPQKTLKERRVEKRAAAKQSRSLGV